MTCGFGDLPAEIRNRIYGYRVLFREDNGEHKPLTVAAFRMRYQMLLPLLLTSPQITSEMENVILGGNTLHLKGHQNHFSSYSFTSEGWNFIRYAHIRYVDIRPPWAIARNPEKHHFYEMELPPAKLRRFFKLLKITLQAPRQLDSKLEILLGRDVEVHERVWNVSEIDWLYPVRELDRLGFSRLQRVDIEVKYYPDTRAH